MDRKTAKRKEGRRRRVAVNNTPVEESLLIRQRLRNLIELAVAIGQKEGLLGNHKETSPVDKEGGQNVANKGNIRDCKATPSRQGKTGNHEGE